MVRGTGLRLVRGDVNGIRMYVAEGTGLGLVRGDGDGVRVYMAGGTE